MPIFGVRSYNGSYLRYAYVFHLMKFTAFSDESIKKNKSISSKHEGFKL